MFDAETMERFWSRILRGAPNECWPWQAGHNGVGYGIFYVGTKNARRQILATRYACACPTRHMPPSSVYCLHSCDNPTCCNPAHLRWGTARDNTLDAIRRNRASKPPVHYGPAPHRDMPKGESNTNSIFTNEVVREIYRLRLSGLTPARIASQLGYRKEGVKDICYGRSWRHMLGVDGNPTLSDLKAVEVKPVHVKLTREMAEEIKRRLAAGETGRSIAKLFNVHFGTVSDIKTGKTWT